MFLHLNQNVNKIFTLLAICLISLNVSAANTEKRRSQIISVINEEIRELNEMMRTTGVKSGEEMLRVAELHLEKARLTREAENKAYLAISSKKRSKVSKRKYFSKSRTMFTKAKNICVDITKKYPRYKHIADAYYIIAFDEKENGKMSNAGKYFDKAIKLANSKETKVRTQIALAEIYYNQQKYKKAIPLYEKALDRYKDRWWTKDSFNLAWSYFRVNKYSKSIAKLKEVFKFSKSSKYVDMREQVERDIGMFYAISGRVNEGIAFYRKLGKNFVQRLIVIASTLKSQSQLARALQVLNLAEKYEKRPEKLADIYVEQMLIGESYGKTSIHLKTTKKLLKLHKEKKTKDFHLAKLRYQAGLMAAKLQRQIAGKQYQRLPKIRLAKASQANEYFQVLIDLDVKKAENYFFKGETSFIVKRYEDAYLNYQSSFRLSKNNDRKLASKSMEGILAIMAAPGVKKTFKEKNYVGVYRQYLKFDPKSKVSNSVYQKLFRVHMDRGEYAKMEAVIKEYVAAFPKNTPIHEGLISNYIEKARKAKKYNLIRFMVADIKNNIFNVTPKFKVSLEKLLTSLQIKDVQDQLKRGQKKKALIGYHHILDDKHATAESRKNAAYNIATLYYQLADAKNTHKWALKSMKFLGPSGVEKNKVSFLAMSSFMLGKQEFDKSVDIGQALIKQNCKYKASKSKTTAFTNTAYILMSKKKYDEVHKFIIESASCKVGSKAINDVYVSLMNHYIKLKRARSAETVFMKLSNYHDKAVLIEAADSIRNLYKAEGDMVKASALHRSIQKIYSKANKNKLDLVALDIIAKDKIISLAKKSDGVLAKKLAFPQKKFDQTLKKKLALLDQLTNEARSIQKLGSGYGAIQSLNILRDTYTKLVHEVDSFVPPGKSKKFVASFKNAMKGLTGPLRKTARNFKTEALKLVNVNKILEYKTFDLLKENHKGIAPRYWTNKYYFSDREGNR